MANRPSREAAGRKVQAAVAGLSDALLQDEEAARANMEAVFVGALPAVSSLVLKGTARTVPAQLAGRATRAVEATAGPYRVLGAAAMKQGVNSIRAELLICERALGRKYKGLAFDAVGSIEPYADSLLATGADGYLSQSLTVVPWFRDRVRSEMATSAKRKEPDDVKLSRIISTKPLRGVVDHSGRGLWWKVLEQCNRAARESEFAGMNQVRLQAMTAFNDLGEGM